jgi:putative transposase
VRVAKGGVLNKAIHLALGVNLTGQKERLGLWMTQNESSKFWLSLYKPMLIAMINYL